MKHKLSLTIQKTDTQYSFNLNTSVTGKTNLWMSNITMSDRQYNWKSTATYHSQLIHWNQTF